MPQPFGRDDAGYAGKIVGDADIAPMRGVEERLNRGQAVVAELQNQQTAGLQVLRGFGNEQAVEFVAFVPAEKSDPGLVLANFDRQLLGFTAPDVRRIADDEIERKWRATSVE